MLTIIAIKLMRAMLANTTERRSTDRKRRTARLFQIVHASCYGLINRARLLDQPNNRRTLGIDNSPMVRDCPRSLRASCLLSFLQDQG